MKLTRWRALAGVVGVAVIAAACGGDDALSNGPGNLDQGVKSEVQNQLNGAASSTTGAVAKEPASMEEWLRLWESERAAIVKKIKDNKLGISPDGRTLVGPSNWTVDLTKCAANWNNVEGLTDTEIKIGLTIAQSGTLADYGNIGRGMDVLWAYQNSNGGFKDAFNKTRKVTMISKDDGYDPARTIPLVDELIDSEHVFAQWTLGSANTLKTYDKLNQRCIPHPFAMTGHPAWGDPVNHPWTTGMALSYTSEAVLWGAFIEKHIDEIAPNGGKVTVGALVMNNDFGKAYDGGFKGYLASSPIRDRVNYQPQVVEPSAPTIKDPMTTIASKNPQIFIAMTAGTSCTQVYVEAAENGLKERAKYLFTGQPCKPSSYTGKDKVGGDGSASNGWWIFGGGNLDGNAAANDTNPFIVWARDLLAKKGYDYKSSGNLLQGFSYGWPMWQSLQIAGELNGGLTRANLMLAIRSLEMTNPNLIRGIKFNLDGAKDGYPIEGSELARYDSATQAWVQVGDVVELSGKSANCAWDISQNICRP